MPELPEVETIVRELSDLTEARIEQVQVIDPHLEIPLNKIVGTKIKRVERQGKYIVFHLSGKQLLIFHLRMSGRLTRTRSPEEVRHTRLILHLNRGKVYFINPRRLGTVEYSRNGFPHQLGVEPLGRAFTVECLEGIVAASRAPIKPLLMNQKKISGIGNIYSAEALWRARIDPCRAGNTLTQKEIRALHPAIVGVLKEAIDQMGTTLGDTISDYRNTSGEYGGFQEVLSVYGREGETCRRCEKEIERIVQAGRSTYFCPGCQR